MTLDRRTRWLALIVLCLGDLMIVLDTTIVNVALPSIRADLGFSQTSLAWVVNAYLLTFGGFLLLGGRLGDLFGHRRLFLIGISLFTVASIACGLSTTQGLLVAARAVQGLGGAIVSAVALSLMMNLFTEPAERAKAMGVFGFVMAGGGSLGVLLGGVLTDTLSWHWIFLVNVPIGVAVYVALAEARAGSGRSEGDRTDRHRRCGHRDVRADARGLRDRQGQRRRLGHRRRRSGCSPLPQSCWRSSSRSRRGSAHRSCRSRLFKLRNVATANVVGILWAAAMFAWFFLSALYLQLVLGYSPLQVGLAFLPSNLIMGAFSLGLSAKLVMRFGLRLPLAAGLLAGRARPRALRTGSGRRALHRRRAPEHDPARLRRRHGVQPGAARRDERRRAEESGLASGVVNTAFMMGGALGLAVLASLAASRTDSLLASGDSAARSAERRLPRSRSSSVPFAASAAGWRGVTPDRACHPACSRSPPQAPARVRDVRHRRRAPIVLGLFVGRLQGRQEDSAAEATR